MEEQGLGQWEKIYLIVQNLAQPSIESGSWYLKCVSGSAVSSTADETQVFQRHDAVYDFEYFQGQPSGLFEFGDL